MAKASSTELLGQVLQDLNEILSITKKNVKEESEKQSNVPMSSIGKISIEDTKNMSNVAVSLGSIATSISVLRKVSKKDVEHVADIMQTLSTAIKSFKISKEDHEGFDRLMLTFANINKTFSELTEHTFKNFFKFSPLKGRILGARIGKFYKNVLKGFESEKLGDFISKFKGSKNLGNNLAGFSQVITALFSIEWKQLLKIGHALRLFPTSGGKNIADFLSPIIDLIKTLPSDHTNLVKVESVITGNSTTKSFTADSRVKSFMDLFNLFTNISTKSILRMAYMGKKLNAELGKNIAGFFTEITKMISKQFKDSETFRPQLKSFSKLLWTLSSIPMLGILHMVLMGKVLNKKLGSNIGDFFASLIEKLNKPGDAKTKNAVNMVRAFSLMLISLTASFAAMVAIVALAKPAQIAIATILLVGLINLAVFTIKKLSDTKIANNSKSALATAGAFSIILITLSAVSIVAAAIGKEFLAVAGGIACIALLVTSGILMIKALNEVAKKEKTLKNAIKAAGAISLSIIALSVGLLVFAGFAAVIKEIGFKGAALGVGVATIIVGGTAAILYGLSKISKKALSKGIVSLGIVVLGVLGISLAMKQFGAYMNLIKGMSRAEAWRAVGIAGAIVLGVAGIMAAAGFAVGSVLVLAAGLAALGIIAGGIALISASLTSFVDFMLKTKQVKESDVEHVINIMTGENGMLGCLKTIIKSFSEFGVIASIKARMISKNLGPVFTSLSSFVDVIQKMGSMQIIDHYETDRNGNMRPVYRKMSNDDFTNAAETLSTAFTTFINQLYKEFKSPVKVRLIKNILDTFKKGDIGSLMNGIGSFAKAIIDFASLRVADRWDKDGNPIHYTKLTNDDFTNAAETLSTAFTTFITKLKVKLSGKEDDIKDLMKLFKKDDENSLENLINQISHTIDPLAKIASGKWNDVVISKDILTDAVNTFIDPIVHFINKLSINKDLLSDRSLRRALNNTTEAVIKSVKEFTKINGETFYKNTLNFKKGSLELLATLEQVKSEDKDKSKIYKNILVNMSSGLKKFYDIAKKSWDPINRNAKALSDFDSELIVQRDARNQVMTEIASNFQSMTEQVDKFNDSFRDTVNLLKKYLDIKSKNEHNLLTDFKNNTTDVFNSVGNAVTQSAEKISETFKPDNNQTNAQIPDNSNAALVNAITGALAAWSQSSKNVTLELSDSGVKALGKVYLR